MPRGKDSRKEFVRLIGVIKSEGIKINNALKAQDEAIKEIMVLTQNIIVVQKEDLQPLTDHGKEDAATAVDAVLENANTSPEDQLQNVNNNHERGRGRKKKDQIQSQQGVTVEENTTEKETPETAEQP